MQYTKLIKDNRDQFEDADNLIDFLDSYLYDNKTIEDIEDNLHEYTDGLVPIYYNDIIKEWQENTTARGMAEDEGLTEGISGDVYKIMQTDLFCYYSNIINADYNSLIGLIDDEADEVTSK